MLTFWTNGLRNLIFRRRYRLMNRYFNRFFLLLLSIVFITSLLRGGEFYVAPDGNDSNPGTKAAPFASLTGARNAVRAAKKIRSEEPWTVHFAEGIYTVSDPVVFEPQDSGTEQDPIVYQGVSGKSVISGGQPITGWKKADGENYWYANLPKSNGVPVYFEQLFVNGRRAIRARYPNQGFLHPKQILEEFSMNPKTRKNVYPVTPQKIIAQTGDLDLLKKIPQKELRFAHFVIHHNWDSTRRIILGYDAKTESLQMKGAPQKAWNPWRLTSLYYIENVRTAFDQPGEWFYDGCAEKVFYRPLSGESLDNTSFQIPRPGLVQHLKIIGTSDKKVSNISFKGLTFAFTDSPRRLDVMKNTALDPSVTGPLDQPGPSQFEPAQAASFTEAVVLIDQAESISLTKCQIRNIGEYGIHIKTGSHCCVTDCLFTDLGAGAVRLGGGSEAKFNIIDNCIMKQGGRFHPSATGVWIGNNVDDCQITHNDISDFFYTGISVGWNWGYNGNCLRNSIEFNKIHKIGQGALADMGGVYTLGTLTGTRVCNNVIFDIKSYGYGGWGLYTDEGSEGVLMENNLVYDTTDGSYHQHYGKNNIIRNNIFVRSAPNPQSGGKRQIAITRIENHLSIVFERNIIYWDGGPAVGGNFNKAKTLTQNNIWWDTTGTPDFGKMTYTQWQESGKDPGGSVLDPKFVNPSQNDFRFKKNSPIHKTGFKIFDYSKAGSR